ncbi:23S rRNA (pseudouridine(1915)-N(3))-methyltransferase RlmH [Candidatus Protochlamydia phocaeensis]|uniref:23S rRNA (pseudouridine(1915)-N(3))-methyltransferase RlmH n=1 Tax=Candidatus Protochlamydia phocaeensis TaxID=1414722 RepID=UPI000837B55A|nr:23S rRNA (pseudouridine(1915)-N(3))-methyltransferase RlmH [Candidatus Protochlamydia phocaeensis]
MLKLKILSVGKTKEKWLEDAFDEYVKRLRPIIQVECQWAKDSAQLLEWAQKEAHLICLDPAGKLLTSEQFAAFLESSWQKSGSRLTLVIGGAEGLPTELKQQGQLISLSPLTFTHQITRLVLIEQIYRATEINKGSQYHK